MMEKISKIVRGSAMREHDMYDFCNKSFPVLATIISPREIEDTNKELLLFIGGTLMPGKIKKRGETYFLLQNLKNGVFCDQDEYAFSWSAGDGSMPSLCANGAGVVEKVEIFSRDSNNNYRMWLGNIGYLEKKIKNDPLFFGAKDKKDTTDGCLTQEYWEKSPRAIQEIVFKVLDFTKDNVSLNAAGDLETGSDRNRSSGDIYRHILGLMESNKINFDINLKEVMAALYRLKEKLWSVYCPDINKFVFSTRFPCKGGEDSSDEYGGVFFFWRILAEDLWQ